MSRKVAREVACQLVFEFLFTKKENLISFEELAGENKLIKADRDFALDLYRGVIENFSEFEEVLKNNIKDFSFSQVVKMDEAVLLVALFELKQAELDKPIVINEALNVAKKFSTDKSAGFINGVLSSILRGENGDR